MSHQSTRKLSARKPSEGAVRGEAIDRLSVLEVTLLTQLLCLPVPHCPTSSWLSGQENAIRKFPQNLLRAPTGPFQRFAEFLHLKSSYPKAELCATHQSLKPELIRRLFLQLTAEITIRLRILTSAPCEALTFRVVAAVSRLQTLHSLWMSEDLYRVAFQVTPAEERYERIQSGCEACILACVGGNAGVLADLRAVALSRKTRGKVCPRIMRLIDGWIKFLDPQTRDIVLSDSDATMTEMRCVRKQLRRKRHEAEKQRGTANIKMTGAIEVPGLPRDKYRTVLQQQSHFEEPPVEIDHEDREERDDDQDYEGSIISHYRRLIPTEESLRRSLLPQGFRSRTARLPNDQRRNDESKAVEHRIIESAMHPAFRESLVFPIGQQGDPPSCKDKHPHPRPATASSNLGMDGPQVADNRIWYTESVHSLDADSTDPRKQPLSGTLRKRAEQEVQACPSGKGKQPARSTALTISSSNRLPDTRARQKTHYSESIYGQEADNVVGKVKQPQPYPVMSLSGSLSTRHQDRRADHRTQYSESIYSQDAIKTQGKGQDPPFHSTSFPRSFTHRPQDNPFSRSYSARQKDRLAEPVTQIGACINSQDADHIGTVAKPSSAVLRQAGKDEARALQESFGRGARGPVEARNDRPQARALGALAGPSRNVGTKAEKQQEKERRETNWTDFYKRS